GAVKSAYHPRRTVVGGSPENLPALPMLEGRGLHEARATAYVCRDFSCTAPIHTLEELMKEMGYVAQPAE
ncbi:MAG: hypothetical protein ACQET1_08770, partial [Gemmatimonadota bacterium]